MAKNNKFYTQTKEIGGKSYTAQFNGLSEYLRALDELYISDESRNISTDKLTRYILENVIVEPKGLSPDDFDSFEDLNAVVKFGQEVMQVSFGPRRRVEERVGLKWDLWRVLLRPELDGSFGT